MYAFIPVNNWLEQERPPSDDPWDQGDTVTHWEIGDTFYYAQSLGSKFSGKVCYEEVPITFQPQEAQIAFLLYAIYDTGCSFGTDRAGRMEVIALFADEDEAWTAYRKLECATNQEGPVEITVKGISFPYSVPWTGYFEQLNELEVKQVICAGAGEEK